MARLGTGEWSVAGHVAKLSIGIAGMPGYTVDMVAAADSIGPLVTLPGFYGGMAEATVRGPERPGGRVADPSDKLAPAPPPWRPTIRLVWRSPSDATASDAGLLATDRGMQRAVRLVMQGVNTGRPPGVTNIVSDDRLVVVIREMRRDRVRITEAAAASRAGFTLADIRGYLRATNRTWRAFLDSF